MSKKKKHVDQNATVNAPENDGVEYEGYEGEMAQDQEPEHFTGEPLDQNGNPIREKQNIWQTFKAMPLRKKLLIGAGLLLGGAAIGVGGYAVARGRRTDDDGETSGDAMEPVNDGVESLPEYETPQMAYSYSDNYETAYSASEEAAE